MQPLLRRLPFFLGGLMGPFGTIVIIPMYPELEATFDATKSQVNLGYSLYLIPFAAGLLVSGTMGERWGRRRTVRGTYLLYAAASVVAALAPSLWVFVAARAVQGVANAFITPLLIAGLAEIVPENRLGREVGIYAGFQAMGGGLGPFLGGVAADTQWQYAFWGTAVLASLLALAPPPGEPRHDLESAPSLRPLLTRRMVMLGLAFGFLAAGPLGVGVLVGVAARSVLEFNGTITGLLLFVGAIAVLLTGRISGYLLDRFGRRRVGLIAMAALTVLSAGLGLPTTAVTLGLAVAVVSMLIGAMTVMYQSVGASIMPENRGGALSFLLGFRFFGHAIGPLIFVPMIDRSVNGAFVGAASLGLVVLGLLALYLPDSAPG